MSEADDKAEVREDDLFAERARALFDESVAGIDGHTQSRLNRNRQVALAELDRAGFRRWSQWVPATGVAAVAVLAVALWQGNATVDPVAPPPLGDFELLLAEDSFEMLQDLEFYSWIDVDIELNSDADVG